MRNTKLYQNRLLISAVATVALATGLLYNFRYLEIPFFHSGVSRLTVGQYVHHDDPLSLIKPASHPKNHIWASKTDGSVGPWFGLWRGQWEGTLDAYFVAVEQKGNRVKAFYSWGTNLNVIRPGQRFLSGVAMDEVLTFPMHAGNTLVFKLISGSDHIEATHYTQNSDRPSRAIFTNLKNTP